MTLGRISAKALGIVRVHESRYSGAKGMINQLIDFLNPYELN